MNRENHEDHHRKIHSKVTNYLGIQEAYFSEVSEEIEGRETRKLSQELSKTESWLLGALSRLDEFRKNPQARTHTGPVPETSWNLSTENQWTNEDSSQTDPYPEVGVTMSLSS